MICGLITIVSGPKLIPQEGDSTQFVTRVRISVRMSLPTSCATLSKLNSLCLRLLIGKMVIISIFSSQSCSRD